MKHKKAAKEAYDEAVEAYHRDLHSDVLAAVARAYAAASNAWREAENAHGEERFDLFDEADAAQAWAQQAAAQAEGAV